MTSRRDFISAAALTALATAACGQKNEEKADPRSWWQSGKYFVHDTVDASRITKGIIRARVDDIWRDFKIADLCEEFVQWSLEERLERLTRLADHGFNPKDLAGPHNACVATYGGPTRDSSVSLNTAFKGVGFAPVSREVTETVERLQSVGAEIERKASGNFVAQIKAKTTFLSRLYTEQSLFDRTKQVSMELFATVDYPTHTFLNMMTNPVASASFLAYPTFEFRAIPQLLHPLNPNLTKDERNLVIWTNAIHDFVHGGSGNQIVCIYHIIELYDDTPSDTAKGRRLV